MDKKRGLGSLALIALVAGALFRPAAGERSPAAGSGARPSHESAPDRVSSRSRPDDDAQADTLDVLADSLGVDTSTAGLIRRAERSVKALRRESTDMNQAAAFLKALLALQIRKDAPGLCDARDAGDTLAKADLATSSEVSRFRPEIDRIEQFLERYFNDDALHVEHPTDQAKLLAEDFERVEKTALKLALIKQVASDEPQTLIRFLIATLPDPIDSFTGWQFDPMLDAITQAISESDYIFDRFYFPDTDREPKPSAESGRIHEDEPSLVIFRRHIGPDPEKVSEKEQRERLVLLIVHENPSAGVHDRALARAIRLVESWAGPGQDGYVRVLGPTFSGSSDSMVRAIKRARRRTMEWNKRIWIVSGSATDPVNKNTLENALQEDPVTFQATVQGDDVLLKTLMQHVVALGWSTRMAVVSEGNTQYGREMRELADKELKSQTFAAIVHLQFPLNISRLRTTAQPDKSPFTNVLGLPSRFRPLAMEQTGTPEDQIPQFSARTTASYMELALSGLLQTLRREHIGTIALMATDPRDKLYLAQQIAHDAPDVSIMTAESDSLYGHPDYSSYLQGAVVASTYPLFSGNQRWSYGFQGDSQRRQLANGSSQGIYNAALALLNYTQDGTPYDADSAQSGHIKSVPKLLEYSSPMERSSADASCAGDYQPPIWISVVGRSGAWPVRAYPAPASDALSKVRPPKRSYVFHVRLAAAARQDALTTFPSPIFVAMCIVLMSATLVGWLGARSCLPKLIAENPAIAPAGSQPLKGLSYVLLCILSVFVIDAFVAAILLARFRIDWTFWCGAALAAIVVSVALLADLTSRVVAHGWPNRRTASWARVDVDKVAMWRGTGIGVVALWAVGNLLLYVYPLFISTSSIDTIGFVTRAISFGSGVCPTLPVLFLMAALALWTIAELKRAWTPGAALADLEVRKVIVRTVTGTVEKMSPHWAFFNRSIVAVPPELAVVVAFAVAAACIFAFDPVVSPLVTVEGPRFGRFVSTGLLATETLIGLSILQFIYLWWALKQVVDRMAWHPMADAYQHVPSDLFPPVVFPKIPRFMELQSAVTRWQQYVRSASPVSLRGAVIPVECRDIDLVFQGEMRKSPDQHWSKSKTWSLLVKALGRPALDSALVGTSMASFTGNEPTADAQEQDLIAVSMALVIRDAIARLGQNLVFITGGTLLVFCAHTLFPFQSHTQLAALDWTAIGLTFAAILIVLVQMKRHEIIGRVSSVTSAERTTWDAEFVLKLVVFCLLPLLTLFATQFPEVGATILSWLEPVEKALP